MSRRSASAATPEDVLAPFAPEVRALAEELRVLVRGAVAGVEERAYPGWKGIGYRDAQSGYFCGIFPRAASVRLLFEHGMALADPDGLFTGGARQVRWIEIRPRRPAPARRHPPHDRRGARARRHRLIVATRGTADRGGSTGGLQCRGGPSPPAPPPLRGRGETFIRVRGSSAR